MEPVSAPSRGQAGQKCPACNHSFGDESHLGVSLRVCESCKLLASGAETLETLAREIRGSGEAELERWRQEIESSSEVLPRVDRPCPECGGSLTLLLRQPWVACEDCGLRLVPLSSFGLIIDDPHLAYAGSVGARGKLPAGKESPRAILMGGGILSILVGIASLVGFQHFESERELLRRSRSYMSTDQSEPGSIYIAVAVVCFVVGIGLFVRAFSSRKKDADGSSDGST